MAKRPRSWEDEFERQRKIRVFERIANQYNPDYMSQVYEKTTDLLYQGAKKLFKELNQNENLPGCSQGGSTSDIDMEEMGDVPDEEIVFCSSDNGCDSENMDVVDEANFQMELEFPLTPKDKRKQQLIKSEIRTPSPYKEPKVLPQRGKINYSKLAAGKFIQLPIYAMFKNAEEKNKTHAPLDNNKIIPTGRSLGF